MNWKLKSCAAMFGSARTWGTVLTRSSERERSGLGRWETEGGALARDARARRDHQRAARAAATRGAIPRNAKNRTSWHG